MSLLLTDLVIRQTKAPATGRLELWDSKVPGLLLRVTDRGVRSWSVSYRYEGEKRRLTLGEYRPEESIAPGLTLGEARKRAAAVLRDVGAGGDPQGQKVQQKRSQVAERRREGASFEQLAQRWLKHGRSTKGSRAGKPWRPKTRAEFERLVRVELVPALGDLKPEEVTKRQIRGLYDQIERRSPSVAKHVLAVLKLLFTWAAEEDHVDALPAFPKRGTQSNKRTRVLEEAELRAVMRSLDAGLSDAKKPRPGTVQPMAEAFRLVLLTAQRRGEVLSLRWADMTEEKDGAWWTIPPERHKSGRAHRVPLTAPAVETLKRLHTITGAEEYLFPAPREKAKLPFVSNPQKAAARLWKSSKVKGATIHDLRRSAATYMVRLGVPRLVVKRVLGHSDDDVTGRYDVHSYDGEKRATLQKWAAELQRIATAKPKKAERKVLPWVG